MNLTELRLRLANRLHRWAWNVRTSPTVRTPERAAWHALPGNRIELGASGFAIELRQRIGELPYLLIDPEGRMIARAGELQPLKAFGERLAKERDEFRI